MRAGIRPANSNGPTRHVNQSRRQLTLLLCKMSEIDWQREGQICCAGLGNCINKRSVFKRKRSGIQIKFTSLQNTSGHFRTKIWASFTPSWFWAELCQVAPGIKLEELCGGSSKLQSGGMWRNVQINRMSFKVPWVYSCHDSSPRPCTETALG